MAASAVMDFDLVQNAGPEPAIGTPRFISGTTRHDVRLGLS